MSKKKLEMKKKNKDYDVTNVAQAICKKKDANLISEKKVASPSVSSTEEGSGERLVLNVKESDFGNSVETYLYVHSRNGQFFL